MIKGKYALVSLILALTMAEAVVTPFMPAASSKGGSSAVAAAAAKVGQAAPEFTLTDTQGKQHSLSQYKGKFVVLEWINFDCPFVQKHYNSGNMQKLQDTYTKKGVVWLSINTSGKGKYGHYEPAAVNAKLAKWGGHQTAYLQDDGTVARLYGAKATPHMYVIDEQGKLIYAGAIDDKDTADEADVKSAKNYVAATLDAAMAGKPVVVGFTKAYGCHVHYD